MNLINKTSYKINEKEINEYAEYLKKKMNKETLFSLVFVENKIIKQMNKEFREKNYPTDVLSFCEEDENYLGDIIISVDKVVEQSKLYKHSEKRELYFLFTHGYLHLNGYDHLNEIDEKKMFDLQKKLLKDYGIEE